MLKQVIAEQLASLQQYATVKQRLRKIGNTLLSHRQLSQQEAAFLVAGLHLKGSSRATVFVAAIPKHQQTRLVRPSHQLRELDAHAQMFSCMGCLIVMLHDLLEHHLIV